MPTTPPDPTLESASPARGAAAGEGLRLAGWWSASVAVAFLHNGLWATPNLAFWSLIAANPSTNPFDPSLAGDYLLTNVSLPSLANLTGQTDPHAYARMHAVLLLVLWALAVVLARRRFGYRAARALTVVLAAAPLVTVSTQWLGQPDPLTGFCGVAMLLVRPRWAVALLGVVAGLTHPEQAVFMALVVAAVRPLLPATDDVSEAEADAFCPRIEAEFRLDPGAEPHEPHGGRWWPGGAYDALAAVGGVLAGRLVTQLYFVLAGITVRTPRTDYLDYGLDTFLEHHTHQPLGLLWTLWGPLWLLMVGLAVLAARRSPRPGRGRLAAVSGAAAVLALLPVLVTLDETRVYAVLTAPLLVVLAVLAADLVPEKAGPWAAAAVLAVTAAIPGGFATGVTSWRSQLPSAEMAEFLWDGSLPQAEDDLTVWLLDPFDFVIPDPPDT